MNLGLHGLLLQVIVSIVQFQHGFRLCSAGEPGYLDFDNLPETNFSCQGKVIGGYYADVEAGCQMFHVCTIGQKDEIMDIKFLCLNGTVFDQETRVCERVDEVDCSKSERFYNLNLELYGNHAVTLSLHESGTDEEDESSELIDDHESQRTTSARPSTTSSTTTTSPRPSISSTTAASGSYQHPNGYPQHYQPQPRFPPVQTSQSKSLYDDKNGGYHHQYIYHTGDHRTNNLDTNNPANNNNNNDNSNNNNNNENSNNNDNSQATSYQLFSNQGVSSTTGAPQIHQIRYSSTPATQIQIHNDHQPTVSPIFHATSSTIQTLLNSNANSPALINPIFHNHGIASTTEQFTVHNNNPRETDEYRDDDQDDRDDRRPLEAVQPTTQGKVSKLTISPIPAHQEDDDRSIHQAKNGQQQRVTTSFLPTPSSDDGQSVRSFYPTPRTSTKSSSSHVTHIHLPPPPTIPHLKPHQITINLPTPDIQRIVQNPSPLLPSQSRVIVTAKASVSDESGRSLNTTQLVTLPLPTIPASYDDYKEGDESFDPFYRDVPKIRNGRRIGGRFRWPLRESREKRSPLRVRRDVEGDDAGLDKTIIGDNKASGENRTEVEKIESGNEEVEVAGGKKDELTERKNYPENVMGDDEEAKLKWENDEEKELADAEKSKTENGEVKDVDDVEDKISEMENDKPKDMADLKTMSSRYRSDSGEKVDEKSVIDIKVSDGDEYVDDVKFGTTVDADIVDLKTMSSKHLSDSGAKVDEKSAINTKESDGDEYVDDVKSGSTVDADIVDLKTMSSKHLSDSGEKVAGKSAINTKESDGDEYVDDVKSVSAVDTDMVDLKTMSSRHRPDSGEKVDEKSAIDTKESDGDEYVEDVKSGSVVDTRESDAEEYVETVDETFDSKIFDEPESQTSKEVDTRAVAELDSKYSKDLTNRFEKEDKRSNHEYSNGLGTTKRGPEEESSRFSLLPEVVSPMKSHRRHPTKKLTLKERVPAEEEDEDETKEEYEEEGDEEAEEEVADERKSHGKHSAKKLKTKQRLTIQEEEDDESEEEDEVADRRKSHNKHSAKKLKTKQRLTIQEEEDEESEEEDEIADQRKSHNKHSAKKLKTKLRLPVDEEEEEGEEDEEVADQIKSHNKHSAKKVKSKQRRPIDEEEDEESEGEEEFVDVRNSQRKHSAKEQRLPEELEEEEEDQGEEVINRRKSDRKHSAKKSKKKDRFPAEQEDEEDRSMETSLENSEEEKLSEERQTSGEKNYDERETLGEENLPESYDYYDSEMDSTSVRSDEEDSAEYSKESPNKIDPSSRHRQSSRHGNSFKVSDEPSDKKSSHRRDKSRKFGGEDKDEEADYDFPDGPATQSNEEVSSIEMSHDYVDNSRMSTSHEGSPDEEMLRDDATRDSSSELSDEVTGSTEKLSSSEDATPEEENSSRPTDERMSEGVLKFTDEIPSSQGTAEPEQVESSKSMEHNSQDYIDDNYEPQSYKEREESSSTTEASMTEKILEKETTTLRTEDEERTEEISTTEMSSTPLTEKAETEDKQNDEARLDAVSPEADAKIEKAIEKPIESDETTSAASPTSTTSTTTTTTTTTTSTTTTTTTTARPTPPKLFKPFTLRKTYVYSPPTTTPVPVVIKPRLALLNPKPAKPPKSYNELAPKPVIRKTPLFARKTTVRTTTPRTEVESTESPTELPVGRTENSAIEETTSGASTTPIPTTEALQTSSQATVTVASKMEDDNSSVKENHNSSVKENHNSSMKENDNASTIENHVPLSTTERFQPSSTMDTQTFTPYPLLVKMTEAAVALEELLAREEAPGKEEIYAMDRADVENNNVPSASETQISTTPEASTTPSAEKVSSEKPISSSTEGPQIFEIPAIGATSVSSVWRNHVTTSAPEMKIPFATTTEAAQSEIVTEIPEITTTLKEAIINNAPTLASIRAVNRRPGAIKRTAFFNCLDKEMYRYYADGRDCRLFHFCSPGFTSRQVLDFRFVCEEGTAFDEESQSCIHDVKNPRCRMRVW